LVYIRLVEYALQALDIYTINVTPLGLTNVRSAAYVALYWIDFDVSRKLHKPPVYINILLNPSGQSRKGKKL